mmetsp:Transcript_7631/g.22534  ORF Transcript_7631/g.22534 Transcript_7631/m.22534 type:complete len:242 (-) Transcript_7631:400-1125(-)
MGLRGRPVRAWDGRRADFCRRFGRRLCIHRPLARPVHSLLPRHVQHEWLGARHLELRNRGVAQVRVPGRFLPGGPGLLAELPGVGWECERGPRVNRLREVHAIGGYGAQSWRSSGHLGVFRPPWFGLQRNQVLHLRVPACGQCGFCARLRRGAHGHRGLPGDAGGRPDRVPTGRGPLPPRGHGGLLQRRHLRRIPRLRRTHVWEGRLGRGPILRRPKPAKRRGRSPDAVHGSVQLWPLEVP